MSVLEMLAEIRLGLKGKSRDNVTHIHQQGSRVTLCMGRMRKEIIGRFRQSGWASILVSTSLKEGLLFLKG